ncbi:type IV pilus modification PilV family protein [Gimesia panareensis]|uniref:Uncharacterized protein n=1 Tax=Gimesia panareensis TaxID=2527978 RepID=A0A517PZN9_9PLAN|nr:type II secretion system protein [Gimesia panareensis]QDT24828.1 hypothetical protein Enr10x_01200 [Gimesia panareensis]QDU47773.1 hypothetical protein Pan110_00830 [Gimesia panareensis]
MSKQNHQKQNLPASNRLEHKPRHGFTLVEMMVSGVLLTTVFMIVVPSLYWVHREQKQTEQRQVALVEVENLMERVAALPYRQINQPTVDKFVISENVMQQLPEADLQIQILETKDLPLMKRIQIQLGWQDARNLKIQPVRLTSWVGPKDQK